MCYGNTVNECSTTTLVEAESGNLIQFSYLSHNIPVFLYNSHFPQQHSSNVHLLQREFSLKYKKLRTELCNGIQLLVSQVKMYTISETRFPINDIKWIFTLAETIFLLIFPWSPGKVKTNHTYSAYKKWSGPTYNLYLKKCFFLHFGCSLPSMVTQICSLTL